MKFRNKQTGKIRDFEFVAITKDMDAEFAKYAHHAPVMICRSIDQLNEEWEDYKPIEPLIKDEKIRKAVRAWAEANDIERVSYYKSSHFWFLRSFNDHEQAIDFWLSYSAKPEMVEGKCYTIAELCGEDEAPEPLEPTFVDMDERTKEKEGQTKKNNITLGESESPDMVADFETGQVRLCAGDPYYDNFVSFKDFLGFAEELKEAMEEKE